MKKARSLEKWKGTGYVKVVRGPEGRFRDFEVLDKVAKKRWANKMKLARKRARKRCPRCGKKIWRKHMRKHMLRKHTRRDSWW